MKNVFLTVLVVLPSLSQAELLKLGAQRGEQIINHARREICVIPKRISQEAQYSKKDLEREQELCSYTFGSEGASAAQSNSELELVAACGKTNSTNPAVQLFKAKKDDAAMYPVSKIEKLNCYTQDPDGEDNDNLFKKLAKYKYSTSCSYTPSILSYYHVSRFLGNINQVPVAVLRTLDVKKHIEIGEKTKKVLKPGATIDSTWNSLLGFLKGGANTIPKKRDNLFTDDFSQSYGALQKNPGGEEKFSELFNGGATQDVRAVNFRDKNIAYQALRRSENPVSKSWSKTNVQNLLTMQNVADMILLDTMLSQEDRFGNLHYTMEAYKLVDVNGVKKVDKLDKLEEGESYPEGTVLVRKLMMKDNDCGVNRTNHLKNARLLEGLSHFNPETYKKLLALKDFLNTSEGQNYFKSETMMSSSDYKTFKANVDYSVSVLQTKCEAGSLKLDLDLDSHFGTEKVQVSCR